jgi:prepilin-type N-terminal cleavage/methylation domain-containing protein
MKTVQELKQGEKHSSVRGFSLIELIVVLAIIAASVALILSRQSRATESTKASDMVQSITYLVSKVQNFYASTGSYAGLNPKVVGQMSLVNQPLKWDGASSILDAWNNPLGVVGNQPGASPTFAITIGGSVNPLNNESCTAMATALASAADVVVVGSTGMNVSSGLVPASGNVYKSSSGTLDLTQLATGCSSSNPVIALQLH